MWWKASAGDLHRVEDRVSTVYAERCHVDRNENAIVLITRAQQVRIPAAMVGALMLGPGTRVTHGAMVLLGDSGTSVCWVGEHGVRFYAGGLGITRSAHVGQRQAELVSDPKSRLRIARQMFEIRFPNVDTSSVSMQQLRGMEGARIKKLYREHSARTGVPWRKREYVAGDANAAGDPVNRLLSAANSSLYGACHAAIVGLGAVPSLGFVHDGSAIAFVLDIADLYKSEYSIPLAFDLAAAGQLDERDARYELRRRFAETGFMSRVAKDVLQLLVGEEGARTPDQRAL